MNKDAKYVFALEPNEEYSERCGEVFLTNIGYLVFHCTLCDMKFKGFEKFADHIRDEHLLSLNHSDFLDSDVYSYETHDYDDNDLTNIQDKEVSDTTDIEEIMIEDVDFDGIDEKGTFEVLDMASTNDAYSMDESESGIKTDDDMSHNADEHNENCLEELNEFPNPCEEIRPVRNVLRNTKSGVDESVHKCHICKATFKHKHNMVQHLLRHSNKKKFSCSQCDKKFFTAAECRVHQRSHTHERPFLCSECGQSFLTNVILLNHMKRHKGKRDFPCPQCDKSFFEKSRLTAHLFSHSSLKPYVCKICNAGYMHSRSLKNHMVSHKT